MWQRKVREEDGRDGESLRRRHLRRAQPCHDLAKNLAGRLEGTKGLTCLREAGVKPVADWERASEAWARSMMAVLRIHPRVCISLSAQREAGEGPSGHGHQGSKSRKSILFICLPLLLKFRQSSKNFYFPLLLPQSYFFSFTNDSATSLSQILC